MTDTAAEYWDSFSGAWTNMANLEDGNTGTYAEESSDADQCVGAFVSNPFTGIPADATIDGITVEIFCYSNDGDEQILAAIYNETDGTYTADKTGIPPNGIGNAADITYGSSSDLWGTSWARSDIIHANFRVRLTKDQVAKAGTVYASRVQVTITYSVVTSYTVTKLSDTRYLKTQSKTLLSDIVFLKEQQQNKTSDTRYKLISQSDKTSDIRYLDETTMQKTSDIRFKTDFSTSKTSNIRYVEEGAGQRVPLSRDRRIVYEA